MKRLSILFALTLIIVQSSIYAQIKVNSSGYVGINNTSPTYRLDVVGTVKLTNNSKSVTYDGTSLSPAISGIDLGTSNYFWSHLYSVYGYFSYAPVVISDVNVKTNITNLTGMIDKVRLLKPVSYDLRTDVTTITVDKNNKSKQYGLIAQDLQQIFPDMVTTDANGVLGIRYTELIPVLIQALNEQQTKIDSLNGRILKLESALLK